MTKPSRRASKGREWPDRRERGHVGEGGQGDRVHAGLGATADGHVAATRGHQAGRGGDGVRAGGARGADHLGRAAPARDAWRCRPRRRWPSSSARGVARRGRPPSRCRRRPDRPRSRGRRHRWRRRHPPWPGRPSSSPASATAMVGRGDGELGEAVDLAHLLRAEPVARARSPRTAPPTTEGWSSPSHSASTPDAAAGDRAEAGDGDPPPPDRVRRRRSRAASELGRRSGRRPGPIVVMSSSSVSSTVMSNASSRAMTSSTRSRLSASRSSANFASLVILSAGTCSTSTAHSRNFSNAASLSTICSFVCRFPERYRPMPSPPSTGTHGAGHVGGGVGGQEADDGGHVGHAAGPAERHLAGHERPPGPAPSAAVMSVSIRPGATTLTVIWRLPTSRAMARAMPDQAGLGGGVVGLPGQPDEGADGRDEDDAARVQAEHLGHGPLGHPERARSGWRRSRRGRPVRSSAASASPR